MITEEKMRREGDGISMIGHAGLTIRRQQASLPQNILLIYKPIQEF